MKKVILAFLLMTLTALYAEEELQFRKRCIARCDARKITNREIK